MRWMGSPLFLLRTTAAHQNSTPSQATARWPATHSTCNHNSKRDHTVWVGATAPTTRTKVATITVWHLNTMLCELWHPVSIRLGHLRLLQILACMETTTPTVLQQFGASRALTASAEQDYRGARHQLTDNHFQTWWATAWMARVSRYVRDP